MIRIPADDRGFTLGHGLFETVLADDGGLHDWAAHLARLQRGCSALGMPPPEETACRAAVAAALRDAPSPSGRFAVRLSWSAGSGGRGLDPPECIEPRLVVTVAPIGPPPPSLELATVSIRRNERSPTSRLKTLALSRAQAGSCRRWTTPRPCLTSPPRWRRQCCWWPGAIWERSATP